MKTNIRLISRLGHRKGQGISKGKMHKHFFTRNVSLKVRKTIIPKFWELEVLGCLEFLD
jgi:hypothetical protein